MKNTAQPIIINKNLYLFKTRWHCNFGLTGEIISLDKRLCSGYRSCMAFFKKKDLPAPPKPKKSLQEIPYERVLTAEGWHRRMIKKGRKK